MHEAKRLPESITTAAKHMAGLLNVVMVPFFTECTFMLQFELGDQPFWVSMTNVGTIDLHDFYSHAIAINPANRKRIAHLEDHLADVCSNTVQQERFGMSFSSDRKPTLWSLLVVLLITMPARLRKVWNHFTFTLLGQIGNLLDVFVRKMTLDPVVQAISSHRRWERWDTDFLMVAMLPGNNTSKASDEFNNW
eukprot:9280352-Karenia_brevis.AAC.1